jgi:hypothetical protein
MAKFMGNSGFQPVGLMILVFNIVQSCVLYSRAGHVNSLDN